MMTLRRTSTIAIVALACLTSNLAVFTAVWYFKLGCGSSIPAALSNDPLGANLFNVIRTQQEELTKLHAEIEQLRAFSAAPKSTSTLAPSSSNDASKDPSRLTLDMINLMGEGGFLAGVAYDPYICYPTFKMAYKNATDEQVKKVADRFMQQAREELARIKGVDPKDISMVATYFQQPGGTVKYPDDRIEALRLMNLDPEYRQWSKRLTMLISRYGTDEAGKLYATNACPEIPFGRMPIDNLGDKFCSIENEDLMVKIMGYHPSPFAPIQAMGAMWTQGYGWCTVHAKGGATSFMEWMAKERMFNSSWHTFDVPTAEEDAVLLLYDLLYEKHQVFKRQYWLGVITMQNPPDAFSIADIIFSTEPDLLIETGTANGGSALMWSSIMEMSELNDSKIITMDINAPNWAEGQVAWGGKARQDPTKHKLWAKRVTFLQGNTVSENSYQVTKTAAASAKKVMVLLDSGHHGFHVLDEMEKYCTMVSVGCYCVVEDTKLSRWTSTGPGEAVEEFMKKHPEFTLDRKRELLYSHHTKGYLLRTK